MFQYAMVCAYREKETKAFLFISDENMEHNSNDFEKIFPNASQWSWTKHDGEGIYNIMQKPEEDSL